MLSEESSGVKSTLLACQGLSLNFELEDRLTILTFDEKWEEHDQSWDDYQEVCVVVEIKYYELA